MSTTAEELLNSLTEEEIAAYTANQDKEPHIIVDETRKITVPDELKRIAVQYDHNIETVTFDCIRYWDDHDMSTMHIYINYMTANKTMGAYLADGVSVDESDPNIMHFTWTISRNVTSSVGPITFLICVKKSDEDGNEVNHWNSELNKDMFVSPGLECSEIIEEDYPDIVEQLLVNIDKAKVNSGWERYKDKNGRYVDDNGNPVGGVVLYDFASTGGFKPAPYAVHIGKSNYAQGLGSIAHGYGCLTYGSWSFASGKSLESRGECQFVIGRYNQPDSDEDGAVKHAFIIGNGNSTESGATNLSNAMTVDWDGNLEIAGGITNLNSGNSIYNADGIRTGLLALGGGNTASGMNSVAMGQGNTASGGSSVAMGGGNTASGGASVAMGGGNTASGMNSVAMGGGNTASGNWSVAMGGGNKASGQYSVAMGQSNTANVDNQTVIGRYNAPDSTEEGEVQHAFIIGNGNATESGAINLSNAMTVDWDGNLEMSGDVTATMPNGSTISLIDIYNRIGLIEERLATLVTPEGSE